MPGPWFYAPVTMYCDWNPWIEWSALVSQYFWQYKMSSLSLSCLAIVKFGWLLAFNNDPHISLLYGCSSARLLCPDTWHCEADESLWRQNSQSSDKMSGGTSASQPRNDPVRPGIYSGWQSTDDELVTEFSGYFTFRDFCVSVGDKATSSWQLG